MTKSKFAAARIAYVAVILFATVSNLQFSPDLHAAHARFIEAFHVSLGLRDAVDGLRNIALFAGLGAVWMITSQAARVRSEVFRATLTGLILSTAVEGLQVFSQVRTASILDVGTNTAGALVGALVTGMILSNVYRAKGAKSYLGIPAMLVAGPYVGATLCEALTPLFHSEPIPSLYGPPATRLAGALRLAMPLRWTEIPVLDIPIYLCAGFLLIAMVRERVDRSRWIPLRMAAAGALGIVALHVLHGAFGLVIRWEAAATDALSFAIGAWCAERWLAPLTQRLRGSSRARAMTLAYAALLVLWAWRPLRLETDKEAIVRQLIFEALIPLASLGSRVDVFSALHVVQQFLLYIPLGALLAVWPLRLRGQLSTLMPAILFVVVVEIGHLFVAERLFDLTNSLIACAGLAVGWLAVRRSDYPIYGETFPRRLNAKRL